MNTTRNTLVALPVVVLLAACRPEADPVGYTLQADRFADSEWSTPVNLGPAINSSFVDANAGLSPNEHEIYFVSTRPGGLGGNDIWVSHRQCQSCDWEAPVNLGVPINSSAADGAPSLSEDGRLLFFFSARPGGFGSVDLYVSRRVSTGADGDVWDEPVNLGPDVNTAAIDQGSYYVKVSGEGDASLYFNRPGAGGLLDIYKVFLSNDGLPLGPAVLVPELSDPAGGDQKVSVRTDGHELFLSSVRADGFGLFDLYVTTRHDGNDPWGVPTHLSEINSPSIESQPNLSRDGRTLIFTSDRPGGFGMTDLWMTTRVP